MDMNFTIDPIWWLIAGVAIGAAEILVPGFILIWFGAAAIAMAALSWLLQLVGIDMAWWGQVIIYAILSVILLFASRKWWTPKAGDTDQPHLNDRTAQMVGRTAVLVEAIEDGRGRIRYGDTTWSVIGPDLPEGRKVKIVRAASDTELEVIAG